MNRSDIQGFDISGFSAAVIGCGGLGCSIAVHLAGSGIGKLHLCDYDVVSQSNLNRQFLYTEQDIGEEKVFRAEKRLRDYNSGVDILSHNLKITNTDDLSFASACDIIFLAADNNAARKTAAEFCAKRGIPLVNGGINGSFGTAYLYVPGVSPCPECAGLLENIPEKIRSVSMTAGIIGALEAQLGIRHLLAPEREAGGVLHVYDNGTVAKLKIKPNPDCGICGQK